MAEVFKPRRAFILGAGMGTRMRPLTDRMPKPMIEIAGRSLIYRALDKLSVAGVREVMVNLHYLPEMLRTHLEAYPQKVMKIHTVFEPSILETGGGVRNVLDFFEDEPFFVISGDALWTEVNQPALERLARSWMGEDMDILTLMQPLGTMTVMKGVGDYDLEKDGRVKRSLDKTGSSMWTNIRLNHPRIYKSYAKGEAFSFLNILDEAEKNGRLFAYEHNGDWFNLNAPCDVENLDKAIQEGRVRL